MKFCRTSKLIVLSFLLLPFASFAQEYYVDITNNTGYTITELYISQTTAEDWEADILAGSTINTGDTRRVDLTGYESPLFDIKLVDVDGDSYTYMSVDVSERDIVATLDDLDSDQDIPQQISEEQETQVSEFDLSSPSDAISYSIGNSVGSNIIQQGLLNGDLPIDLDPLMLGIMDGIASQPKMTEEQMLAVLGALERELADSSGQGNSQAPSSNSQMFDERADGSWNFLVGKCEVGGEVQITECSLAALQDFRLSTALTKFEPTTMDLVVVADNPQMSRSLRKEFTFDDIPVTYKPTPDGLGVSIAFLNQDGSCLTTNYYFLRQEKYFKENGPLDNNCGEYEKNVHAITSRNGAREVRLYNFSE